MRLISEAENTENVEQFYRPLNPTDEYFRSSTRTVNR